MPEDFLLDLDIPTPEPGLVSAPASSPVPAAKEDAPIGVVDDVEPNPRAPFAQDEEATHYFNQVTESEALNYLMFLHDVHAISFDRLNELKTLLGETPSFLPKEL